VSEPEQRRESEDIEFDFFDDAPTREATSREAAEGSRRPRLPRRRPPGGGGGGGPSPQQVRLGALVVGLVVLVLILVLLINNCQGDKSSAYEDYMADVATITSASDRIGGDLRRAIATPGAKLEDLQAKIDGFRSQQAQLVEQTQNLEPPGPLRDEHESFIEAMQLRVSGLAGLALGFSSTGQSTSVREIGNQLADQASRFVASDVVYADLFQARSVAVMRSEDVTGVDVPDSQFLVSPELSRGNTWALLIERLTEAPKAGGLHGNQIEGVVVLPGGERLSPTEETTIPTSEKTAFEVSVRNSGDSLETGVQVTFTIAQDPPIKDEQAIDLIEPGKTKTVVFDNLDQVKFTTPTTLRVNVLPVPGETNTGNNSAEYSVVFSFG